MDRHYRGVYAVKHLHVAREMSLGGWTEPKASPKQEQTPTIKVKLGERLPDAIYESCEKLLHAFQAASHGKGYSIVFGYSGKENKSGRRVIYQCERAGKPRTRKGPQTPGARPRKSTKSQACNCPFKIEAQEIQGGQWRGRVLEEYHNHGFREKQSTPPVQRKTNPGHSSTGPSQSIPTRAIPTAKMQDQLRDRDVHHRKTDLANLTMQSHNPDCPSDEALQCLAASLAHKSDHSSSFYTIETGRVASIFLLHATSIKLARQHPQVLLVDFARKSERFGCPYAVLACATGSGKVLQLALCLLRDQTETSYRWMMEMWSDALKKHGIPVPYSCVTDIDPNFIAALKVRFPTTKHILSRRHVKMSIVADTRPFYSDHHEHELFLEAWNRVIESDTMISFDQNVDLLRGHSVPAVSYVFSKWMPWREGLVDCWVDTVRHYGWTSVPREVLESSAIESLVRKSGESLDGTLDALLKFWSSQEEEFRLSNAREARSRAPGFADVYFLSEVAHRLHHAALLKIVNESKKSSWSTNTPLCSCTIMMTFGLPCSHIIFGRTKYPGKLPIEDCDVFWHTHEPGAATSITRTDPPVSAGLPVDTSMYHHTPSPEAPRVHNGAISNPSQTQGFANRSISAPTNTTLNQTPSHSFTFPRSDMIPSYTNFAPDPIILGHSRTDTDVLALAMMGNASHANSTNQTTGYPMYQPVTNVETRISPPLLVAPNNYVGMTYPTRAESHSQARDSPSHLEPKPAMATHLQTTQGLSDPAVPAYNMSHPYSWTSSRSFY